MAIPFKSLRYKKGREQIWSINIRRSVRWKNEESFLSPVKASHRYRGISRFSEAATLVGIQAPLSSRNLELKPYFISSVISDVTEDPPVRNDLNGDVGFDLKYGLTLRCLQRRPRDGSRRFPDTLESHFRGQVHEALPLLSYFASIASMLLGIAQKPTHLSRDLFSRFAFVLSVVDEFLLYVSQAAFLLRRQPRSRPPASTVRSCRRRGASCSRRAHADSARRGRRFIWSMSKKPPRFSRSPMIGSRKPPSSPWPTRKEPSSNPR